MATTALQVYGTPGKPHSFTAKTANVGVGPTTLVRPKKQRIARDLVRASRRITGVLDERLRLSEAWITLEAGPIITTPAVLGNHFRVLLTESALLEPPDNPHPGQVVLWRFEQPTAGGASVTLNSAGFVTIGDLPVPVDTAAGAVSFLLAVYEDVDEVWEVMGFPDLSSVYALASDLAAHIADTANPHSVTKSQVGLGNVENTALSTWTGSTSITTLGTIATGTWSATAIAADKGGTGQTTYVGAGRILYSTGATALAVLAPGSDGAVLTLAGGVPTWAASGVLTPAYGGMSLESGSTATTVTTAGTFYKFTQFDTASPSSNVTADVATDFDLTVDTGYGGDYLVAFSVSCTATATALIYVAVFVNGSKVSVTSKFANTDGTMVTLSAANVIALSAGDTVDLRVTSNDDADAVTPVEMYLTIHRIGT